MVIRQHPEWIANRDGIPFTARDQANRALLPQHLDYWERVLEQAKKERAEIRAHYGAGGRMNPENLEEQDRINVLILQAEERVSALKAVTILAGNISQDSDKGLSENDRLIIGLDLTNPRTQAIVSVGNPDVAKKIGVFTPGLTSNVPGMLGYDKDMQQMRERAFRVLQRHDPSASVEDIATVTYLGYQSPQLTVDSLADLGGDSVLSGNSAVFGGRDLAAFYRGIDTVRNGDAEVTALGHSYGSTTTGVALQWNTGVDRAVFYGSPGLAADSAQELKVPSGSTYYGEADWDAVGDFGRFGKDPSIMPGMTQLSTDAARVYGEDLAGIALHSSYNDPGTTMQHNSAAVIAGHPEDAVTGWSQLGLGEALTWYK